jgi:protoporphyrinogen oxidase
LSIAYRIASKRPDLEIEILERTDRCGGTIETWSEGEWLCDVAVNASRPHPAFWRLVEDLGLGSAFAESNPQAKKRWLLINRKKTQLSWITALRMGPLRLFRSLRSSRVGKKSVAKVFPSETIADAMTLGIVNERSANVDADFLMPSLTKFGDEPPIKWSKIKKMMAETYPLFQPRKGSVASFSGGMQTLVDALVQQLNTFENVKFHFNQDIRKPEEVATEHHVPISSVIWCAPLDRTNKEFTSLDVYVAGYHNNAVSEVQRGYGTLIPDEDIPISGILHESDVHQSPRAPADHRLFRIMAPSSRSSSKEAVLACLKQILTHSEPVIFKKIGTRKIPIYVPGYMSKLDINREYTRAGWFYSGVSVTHVIAEAERIADLF